MENQNFRSYLPSKKVATLAAVIGIGLVSFIAVNYSQTISGVFDQSGQNNSSETKSIASQQRTDEDSDGLSNWQEKLWGTDSNNSDTDGDGTPDGREVELNRDPTIPAPDDSLGSISQRQDKSTSSETVTERIGQEVLPKALVLAAAKQDGESVTRNDLDRISESIANKTNLNDLKLSDSSEITVVTNSSPQFVEKYFDNLNKSLRKVRNSNRESPIQIIAQAQQEGNPESVDLSSYVLRHKQVVNELKNINVPRPFKGFHLESLQAMERKLYSLRRMNNIAEDPVGAVLGVKEYKKARESDIEATKILNNTLQEYAQSIQ